MKKNSPGCTCCKPHVFTESSAWLTALSDDGRYVASDLPAWAANINATINGDSEAAQWLESSPFSRLLSYAEAIETNVFPGGIVQTPGGWVYYVGHRVLVDARTGPGATITRAVYLILGIDLATNRYTAEESGFFPPVIIRDELRGDTWNPLAKVVPRTPGREARSVEDVYTVIAHDDLVLGERVDATQEQLVVSQDMRQTVPVQVSEDWGHYTLFEDMWNPEFVAQSRAVAQATEQANGFEVYEKNSRIKKYSVPGAIIDERHLREGVGWKWRPFEFAPTGTDVYWLARARKELWRFHDSVETPLIPNADYGPLELDSAFPFAELVKSGAVLNAATWPNSQSFQFLIKNDEPLAMVPTARGSVEYIERQYHWSNFAAYTYTPSGQPIVPYTETRETKEATFVLGNVSVAYSHTIDSPVIVGTYHELALATGMREPGELDSVTLADPDLDGKTIVYKYDGEWTEIARLDDGYPSAVCEGVNGALYVLGPPPVSYDGSWVYRIDAVTGVVERLTEYYFSSIAEFGKNWMAMPTAPTLGREDKVEDKPPPTVSG